MKYTTLGKSGLIVSRICFGTMAFGQGQMFRNVDVNNNIDQNAANNMVGYALDHGINFFDTADSYTNGQSEIMLGKAVKAHRKSVIITTKIGNRTSSDFIDHGLSYRRTIQATEASLTRLGTDYIDLLILHIPDPLTPAEETAKALEHLISTGKVRYIGCSNYPAWMVQKFLSIQMKNNYAPFISSQMYYSLLGRDIENEFIPMSIDNGLGLMVWSPLAGGYLSGKYLLNDEGRRKTFPFPPIDTAIGEKAVEYLKNIASYYNASISQIALAWLLSKSYVSSIIIGPSKFPQLENNLSSIDIELRPEHVAELNNISASNQPYPTWMQAFSYDTDIHNSLTK